MTYDYALDKIFDKSKEIITGIAKFDNTTVLIDADDKLPNNITFENIVILTICVLKDDQKLYPHLNS